MVPTVREADGLAKSSRNVNLSDTERKAINLYQTLLIGKQRIIDGRHSIDKMKET